MSWIHKVEAYNTAAASENKIHDDDVAQKFGFRGGLVPGVEVFAYMSHIPVARWGREWLERGQMSARFAKPVYDGCEAVVCGKVMKDAQVLEVSVESLGQLCAAGEALLKDKPAFRFESTDFPRVDLPSERPPASPESLQPNQALGTVTRCWDETSSKQYIQDIRETANVYKAEGVSHAGFLLRAANDALSQNVRLGPWMHVGSHLQSHSVARLGEPLEARSRVTRNYENKGHLFVELDVLVLAPEDRPVASIRHTAIYEPRQVREASA